MSREPFFTRHALGGAQSPEKRLLLNVQCTEHSARRTDWMSIVSLPVRLVSAAKAVRSQLGICPKTLPCRRSIPAKRITGDATAGGPRPRKDTHGSLKTVGISCTVPSISRFLTTVQPDDGPLRE